MYEIIFYRDVKGRSEMLDWLEGLNSAAKTNKDARINRNKVIAYFDLLEEMGTRVGQPVTKHLDGDIWELRPLKNRILYAYYKDNKFIILCHFIKKTNKTPLRQIEKAKYLLKDYLERNL